MTGLSSHIFHPWWFGSITCLCIPPALYVLPPWLFVHISDAAHSARHQSSSCLFEFLTAMILSAVGCAWQGLCWQTEWFPVILKTRSFLLPEVRRRFSVFSWGSVMGEIFCRLPRVESVLSSVYLWADSWVTLKMNPQQAGHPEMGRLPSDLAVSV